MNSKLKTLITIALTAIIVGGGVYYFLTSEQILSSDQCKKMGGTIIASPGYPVYCENGTTQIGSIPGGDEGAICCK